jgi:hypothetical protein
MLAFFCKGWIAMLPVSVSMSCPAVCIAPTALKSALYHLPSVRKNFLRALARLTPYRIPPEND